MLQILGLSMQGGGPWWGAAGGVLEGCEEELPETTGSGFVPCQDVDAH